MPACAHSWLLLYAAIVLEIGGTCAIKLSDGFTRPLASLCVAGFYCASFGAMSVAVRKIDLGVAYAVWSGVGIVATSVIGALAFQEILTARKAVSIIIILLGVVSLNLAPAK